MKNSKDPDKLTYQLPRILNALLHVDQINVVHITGCAFIRS